MTTYYLIARNNDGTSTPKGTYDDLIKARAKAVAIIESERKLRPRRNGVKYVTVQDRKYASSDVSKYVQREGKDYLWTIYDRRTGFKHYRLAKDGRIERAPLTPDTKRGNNLLEREDKRMLGMVAMDGIFTTVGTLGRMI